MNLSRKVFLAITGIVLSASTCDVWSQSKQDILLVPASPALQQVRTLITANVLGLAEKILEQEGPPMLPDGHWLNWERQIWALYSVTGQWQKLYDRLQSIPPAFPAVIRHEAETQAIEALIALKQGSRARRLIRRHLLSTGLSERDKITVRRWVIESYLSDNLLAEADTAVRVFQADYRPRDSAWLILSARIALKSGNADRAVNVLAPLNDVNARVIQLCARLENNSLTPDQVLVAGAALRQKEEYQRLDKAVLAVMVKAAEASAEIESQAELLEQYLLSDPVFQSGLLDALPAFDADDLIIAYGKIASRMANRAGFLTGEESGWVDFARQIAPERTVARRAIWAYIAHQVNDDVVRRLAIDQYTNAMIDGERAPLATALFGKENPLGELVLSPETGLRLSNVAIEIGDVQLAADANGNVSGPPPGMNRAEWLIYTGRISIFAGRYEKGADHLRQWIESFERLSEEQTDQVLQPVFDMQTVGQHKLAIPLLQLINQRSPSAKHRREIAFWIAESYSATGRHIKAADFFLFSAMQKDNGFDQWGEAARYRAADALLEGNLFADARSLFEGLLARATEEPRRQALTRKLQQVWLRESSIQAVETETVSN